MATRKSRPLVSNIYPFTHMTVKSSWETTFGARERRTLERRRNEVYGVIGLGSLCSMFPLKLVGVSHKITPWINERSRENRDKDRRDLGGRRLNSNKLAHTQQVFAQKNTVKLSCK